MTKNLLFISITAIFLGLLIIGSRASSVSAQIERPRTAGTSVTPTPTPKATPPKLIDDDENGVIKVGTELVNLNVRVIDRNNRPINGLQKNDFKIMEDGSEQQIEFFSKSEVPTNYTLVLDNSGSLRQQLEKVIEAGKILVNSNKPEDETSIIRFISRDKITVEQQFTPNKADLNDTLDNLYIEGGQTAVMDAVYLAVQQTQEYEKSDKPDDRKRRAIVLVTDGEDRDSYYTEPQLMEMLKESDVQIFVIGFVGDLQKEGGFISKSPQQKAKSFLERMATTTGGKSYFPTSVGELPEIARDLSSELRVQYSIGYLPTNTTGGFKNIKVVVNDGPNKEKRIAITKSGRNAGPTPSTAQTPPKTNK
ncbi:MAG: VWA domain-containing protein [Acidobacteriota bacterium]